MQVQVYMPGKAAVGYGIVRTLVKDSRDTPVASQAVQSQVYLDTDGQINNLDQPPLNLVRISQLFSCQRRIQESVAWIPGSLGGWPGGGGGRCWK